MNILLVGEESAGIQALRAIAKTPHRLVGVMAQPMQDGNGVGTLWDAARSQGYPTWPAKLVKDPAFGQQLRAEGVDLLLNMHSLYIVNREVLAAPRLGSFNVHPGPLPRYAGLNSVSWTLYRGERTHGVTVHKMEPDIDTGPIVYQTLFPIEETDTALSLMAKCQREGLLLLLRLLEAASTAPEAIPAHAQDLTQRQYFGREVPEGGRIRWAQPASNIVNFVRACDYLPFRSPWGHPRAQQGDREVGIARAARTITSCAPRPGTVREGSGSTVQVATADEWIVICKVTRGGRLQDAAEVLRPGERLGDGLPHEDQRPRARD